MSVWITQDSNFVSPTQVWSGLTTERQAHVIQFLARLASILVTEESISTPRSSPDDDAVFCPEDPAGSSRPNGPGLRPPIHHDSGARKQFQHRPAK
jgi:hypothetical protein